MLVLTTRALVKEKVSTADEVLEHPGGTDSALRHLESSVSTTSAQVQKIEALLGHMQAAVTDFSAGAARYRSLRPSTASGIAQT